MKRKWRGVSGILCAVLLLTACGAQPSETGPHSEPDSAPNQIESPIRQTAQGTLRFFGQTGNALSMGCGAQAGFYYWNETANDHALLYYIDYTSKTNTPLCARPECSHSDNACTAWLGWRGGYPQLAANDAQLVLAYSNTDARYQEQYGSEALAHIDIAQPDGSGRRTLAALGANEDIQAGIACDDTALYFVRSAISANAAEMSLCAVSLSDGAVRELCALPAGTSFRGGWPQFDCKNIYRTGGRFAVFGKRPADFFLYQRRFRAVRKRNRPSIPHQ